MQNHVGVVPGGNKRVAFIQRNAGEPFGGHHPAPGPGPVHLGHPEILITGKVFGNFHRGGGFETQIHFQFYRFSERIDTFEGLQALYFWFRLDDQPGDPTHQL